MALLCRIKELKSKKNSIFNQFKRFYIQIHTPPLSSSYSSPNPVSDYYRLVNVPKNQGFFNSRVRFFAAPVQFVKKEEEKRSKKPRLNDEIKNVDSVRLVTKEGGHTVVSIWEARRRAKELGFDLVEVDKMSNPPVCRLMNYNKEMFNRKLHGKERAKIKAAETIKSASKEVRFSAKAESKDLKTKADTVKRLMEKGYRVKCTALVSKPGGGVRVGGGEVDLRALLSQFSTLIEDVAIVESEPKIDEKEGHIIVRHIKFGKPKSSHKASKGLKTNQSESHDDESDVDLNDEVNNRPLQGEEAKSQAPNFAPNAEPPSRAPNFAPNARPPNFVPSAQGPNFAPNVGPALQPENRYAKKGPSNSAPLRPPNSGTGPHPQFQRFPPGGPRQEGRQGGRQANVVGNMNPPRFESGGFAAGDKKKW